MKLVPAATLLLLALLPSSSAGQGSPSPWSRTETLSVPRPGGRELFGWSVALSGDTLVVGAPGVWRTEPGGGAVFIFRREGDQWTRTQRLHAPDVAGGGRFGDAVALSGDTLVVGAPLDRGAGSAYVFERIRGSFTFSAKLLPAYRPDLALGFGGSVDVDGSTIVVGASGSRYIAPKFPCLAGSAHVFERTPTGWGETQVLLPPVLRCFDNFGASVSIDGDMLAVGALQSNPPRRGGAVYLFERSGESFLFQQELESNSPHRMQSFGASIDLVGDTLLVGAPGAVQPCGGGTSCALGAGYVFERSGGTFSLSQVLSPGTGPALESVGQSVALGEERLCLGAPGAARPDSRSGSAYVFAWTGSSWVLEQEVLPRTSKLNAFFGTVALDGDALAVGAATDPTPAIQSGSVTVFERSSARVRFRNAGTNPVSYRASKPVLGSLWQARVDLGTTGHAFAGILVSFEAAQRTLPGGQVQLVEAPTWFRLPLRSGPTATWSIRVPSDPMLAGLRIATQAAHLFGERPFVLSNAQDLTLGY